MSQTLGKLNPFRYRGYVYDEETGLYYLRSRYYNPEWGRFINCDSMFGKISRLFSHNLFAYCCNRAVNANDDNGTEPESSVGHMTFASGSVYTLTVGYALSVSQGVAWDDAGNQVDYITYIGVTPDKIEDPMPIGEGMVNTSTGYVWQCYTDVTVPDLLGKGSYIGGSGSMILSFGYDLLFLGDYIDKIKGDRKPNGYQSTIGVGVGLDYGHVGNSFTFLRYTKIKNVEVPKDQRKWIKPLAVTK